MPACHSFGVHNPIFMSLKVQTCSSSQQLSTLKIFKTVEAVIIFLHTSTDVVGTSFLAIVNIINTLLMLLVQFTLRVWLFRRNNSQRPLQRLTNGLDYQ